MKESTKDGWLAIFIVLITMTIIPVCVIIVPWTITTVRHHGEMPPNYIIQTNQLHQFRSVRIDGTNELYSYVSLFKFVAIQRAWTHHKWINETMSPKSIKEAQFRSNLEAIGLII